MLHYLKIWLATARYSVVRTMMFRGDFIVWSLVELFWMAVNLFTIGVLYRHTDSIAGWSQWEMVMLVGTSQLIQRFLMGFFWSSIFEMSRNIRSGHFDFFLAQPGNIMFMATTRKLDLDGLVNSIIAAGVVVFAAYKLGVHPNFAQVATYALFLFFGLVIHYSILVLSMSLAFWITSAQGVEGGYFSLTEFSRLPKEAFGRVTEVIFVWALPVVLVSNIPARLLIPRYEFNGMLAGVLFGLAAFWFVTAVVVFHRGLRRYSSASS